MSNRLFLPLLSGAARSLPTVTAMRDRLGGRSASEPGIGELVRFEPAPGMVLLGVILLVEGDDIRVLTDGGTVRRAKPDALSAIVEPVHEELASLAADVRVFAKLEEGDAVRYLDSKGALGQGTLIEKCRYGALVARPDNVVMGIGFRKLWPEADDAAEAKEEEQAKS